MDFLNDSEELQELSDDGFHMLSFNPQRLRREMSSPGWELKKHTWTHHWFCDEYSKFHKLMGMFLDDPAIQLDAEHWLLRAEPTSKFLEFCRAGHRLVAEKRKGPIGTELGDSSIHDGLTRAYMSLFKVGIYIRKKPNLQTRIVSEFLKHPADSLAARWMMNPDVISKAKTEFMSAVELWNQRDQDLDLDCAIRLYEIAIELIPSIECFDIGGKCKSLAEEFLERYSLTLADAIRRKIVNGESTEYVTSFDHCLPKAEELIRYGYMADSLSVDGQATVEGRRSNLLIDGEVFFGVKEDSGVLLTGRVPRKDLSLISRLKGELATLRKKSETAVPTVPASAAPDDDIKKWADDIGEDEELKLAGYSTRSPERKVVYRRVGQRGRDNPEKHNLALELHNKNKVSKRQD